MAHPRILAAVPMTVLAPDTYLRQQMNLITGQLSDDERFVVTWCNDPDKPGIYIHTTSGILRFELATLVEQAYRALAAVSDEDPWTDFERDPNLDPDDGSGDFYTNALYDAVVGSPDSDRGGTVTVLYARKDRRQTVTPAHWRRIVDNLVGSDWAAFHGLPSPGDDQFVILCSPPPPREEPEA